MSIYISRSKDIPKSLLLNLITQLEIWYPDVKIRYWDEGTVYNPGLLKNANMVILLVQSNARIGKGAYTEMNTAISLCKDSCIAYLRNDNTFHLYGYTMDKITSGGDDWSQYAIVNFGVNKTYCYLPNYKDNQIIFDLSYKDNGIDYDVDKDNQDIYNWPHIISTPASADSSDNRLLLLLRI